MQLSTWIASSLQRHFPASPAASRRLLRLDAARNEQFSFQAVMRLEGTDWPRQVEVTAVGPEGWDIRVRRVGYVPVRHLNTRLAAGPLEVDGIGHIPGYVPDPLLAESSFLLPPGETHAFWITCRPGADIRAGVYELRVRIAVDGFRARTLVGRVTVHDILLAPRRDFRITHWFYADALSDWYKIPLFDEAFWPLCEAYMKNYADHGLDMIYVPVFTPPLDGVKKTTQLLRVHRRGQGDYEFDWTDVRRWVRLARQCGITSFEWVHPFTQWGVKHAIRIYEGQGADEKLLWDPDTGATSATYRRFLEAFLPELKRFLEVEDLLDVSSFHVSDEPHSEADKANYRAARALLRDLAPWIQTMDALTDIEYGRQGLTDMPIPSIRTALEFYREGIESWCYYCCGPRGAYLNRLLDTPLPKIAMHGFLFYRWPFKGFLHWGFNYWYRSQTRELIDPYTVQDGQAWPGWAFGDTFQVYPGVAGPVDSLRWEVFGESLQDYRLLQTLDLPRDHALLRRLRDFNDFPKKPQWRLRARRELLRGAD